MIKKTMDEEGQIEITEKELGLVKDILRTLTKTVKTFNVYPKDNPIYQKFATELFEKFNNFFESGDDLALTVAQFSLLYKENEVFRSEERTDNVALLLFADGIRQISFYKGITPEEITDFIDILRLTQKSETRDEDDIVTLLWEKNIKNMGYTAAEDTVDDDLVVEESLLADTIQQEETGETTINRASFQWRPTSLSSELRVEPLNDHEIGIVKNEFSVLEEKALLSSAVKLFFELLSYENNGDALPNIVHNLGKILDIRMKKKDIQGVMEILSGLKKLSALEQSEVIDNAIDRAGSAENLMILFNESSNNEEIRKYLLLLGPSGISRMIQVLGQLEDRKQRRLLCEVLAEIGRHNVDAFAEALTDERWFLVRNVVMILGMTKELAAVRLIEKTVGHPDFRVRREAVRALEGIQSDETKKLYLAALDDEDLAVRIISLKAMRRFKDPGLFQVLREKASREELKKRPFSEKRELLETIAVLGGEDAFPLLSDLFRKRWFVEKDEITEIRASAAYGLGLLGTHEALSLLEKERGSKKGLLRDACLNAMKESRQSGSNRK